jgi:uncharacterized membrane protein YidH (DUF202 family)
VLKNISKNLIKFSAVSLSFLASASVVFAAQDLDTLMGKIAKVIINPAIVFIFALALVYFLYGLVEFLQNAESPEKRVTGQSHMIWGVVGMFIMISVFTIMRILRETVGGDVKIPQ